MNSCLSRTVDINAVITDLTGLLRVVVGERLVVRTKLDPKLGRINADSRQIGWVFINLAISAYDAMPVGSELLISTSNIELDYEDAGELGVPAGPYVQAELRATGGRINVQTMVREIVQNARGAVSMRSTPGHGSTVLIFFPMATDSLA